ncbi:MAG TPA: nucleoside hydrolase [Roseiflexaceae bacterium]|nr:nucleoside hydrolase [Roseiflexaceae bacterium]
MSTHLRRIVLLLAVLLSVSLPAAGTVAAAQPTVKVFVDTDIGVDDAVAIAYLLRSREADVLGFTTVAGNTTVENATNNLLTLLDVAGVQEPVAVGAAAPLQFPRSRTGAFVHGPDGLWFAGTPHDLASLPQDAPAAIAAAARANPGMTLLALGPLTNVAQAAQRFPEDLRSVKIVALAGTRGPGNSSPVAEFNAFFDPHALDIVLESGLDVTLVTLDAFSTVTFDSAEFPQHLAQEGGALGQFLAQPVGAYMMAQTQGASGPAAIADVAAAVYVLRPHLGQATSALVDVSTDTGLTRGQTVMATTVNQRVTMIATDAQLSELADKFLTPGFDLALALGQILMSRPDNAQVVLVVKGKTIARLVEHALTRY